LKFLFAPGKQRIENRCLFVHRYAENLGEIMSRSKSFRLPVRAQWQKIGTSIEPHDVCNGPARRRHSTVLLFGALAVLMVACSNGESEPVGAASTHGGVAAAPSGRTSSSPNSATLTWDAVTDPDLGGYRIYYGPVSGTYLQYHGKGIDVGNVTTYTITGLVSERRYYFAVTAFDTSNNESDLSNEIFKDIP
jgi:hypothetical protein